MTYYPKTPARCNRPEDYHEKFDPQHYIKVFTTDNPIRVFPLQQLHKFYSSSVLELPHAAAGLSILDYGCGPTPIYQISASAVASEIVMAEYTEKNRQALQQWVSKDPSAHDWSPFFDLVVQDWEGETEQDAREREERLRKLVKAVVPCDVTHDTPIADMYKGPYDVVFSSLCLEIATKTVEEYTDGVAKLASLIKPGGKIVLYGVEYSNPGEHSAFYSVGSEIFVALCISQDMAISALTKAGLHDIRVTPLSREDSGRPPPIDEHDAVIGNFFITACLGKRATN